MEEFTEEIATEWRFTLRSQGLRDKAMVRPDSFEKILQHMRLFVKALGHISTLRRIWT